MSVLKEIWVQNGRWLGAVQAGCLVLAFTSPADNEWLRLTLGLVWASILVMHGSSRYMAGGTDVWIEISDHMTDAIGRSRDPNRDPSRRPYEEDLWND